jgi:addiction module HigA family antidote
MQMHNPPHPGLVLREYLGTLPVTTVAAHLSISRAALSRVLNGRAGISADLALGLADALGTSADFWLAMEAKYDLWQASKRRRKRIEPPAAQRRLSMLIP